MFIMSICYLNAFHFLNEFFIIFSVIIKQDKNERTIRIVSYQTLKSQTQNLIAN